MHRKQIKEIVVLEPGNRCFEQPLVAAVLAPTIMVAVDIRPMDPVTASLQLVPLHAGVQDPHHMVKYFVGGNLRIRASGADREVRFDVAIEIPP